MSCRGTVSSRPALGWAGCRWAGFESPPAREVPAVVPAGECLTNAGAAMRIREQELQRLLEEVRAAGFEFTLSRPDREYRLHVWGRYGEVRFSGTLWGAAMVLKALLLGYRAGKE